MKNYIYIWSILFTMVLGFQSCIEKEIPVEDYTYSFTKIGWIEKTDGDGDEFNSRAILNCSVKLDEPVTRKVYAKLFYKHTDASDFVIYAISPEYNFDSKNSPLNIQIPVGKPNMELPKGTYNFLIELYEVGSDRVEASISIKENTILASQKFEQLKTDQAYTIQVGWFDKLDHNNNGYSRSANLILNVNFPDPSLSKKLYAEIWIKEKNASEFLLIKESDEFTIQGSLPFDLIKMEIGSFGKELQYGLYDFQILIYEAGYYLPVAATDFTDNLALKEQKFETTDNDSYYYSINKNRLQWKYTVDNDGDGYAQSKSIVIDVDVDKPDSRQVFAKAYYKKVNKDTTFEIWGESVPWTITGNSEQDAINLIIDSQNQPDSSKLDSAKYDFLICILEFEKTKGSNLLGASISGLQEGDILFHQKFELQQQDVPKKSPFNNNSNNMLPSRTIYFVNQKK